MMGLRSFRQVAALGLSGSVLLMLAGCSDPMSDVVDHSPKKVAASFVYYIGKNRGEEAGALLFSTEDKPITFESDNIDELRQRAGMKPGCVLGDSWESRVSVVEESDSFRVTVPLRCGNQDDTTTITITKTRNKSGSYKVVVD